jgi:heme A synthase
METKLSDRFLAGAAWGTLGLNLAVILWGAYVRATGSGAGCGSHWPLCNGEVVPRPERIETVIEFTHRLTSGLAFLAIAALLILAFRLRPRGHPARQAVIAAMVFIVTEALLGAGLVLLRLVGQNQSIARAASTSLHLANTYLLLAALTLTASWSRPGLRRSGLPVAIRSRWILGLAGLLFVGMTGAIVALGDTLFPAGSLGEGVAAEFSAASHLFVRLRLIHPALALVVGLPLALSLATAELGHRDRRSIAWMRVTAVLIGLQLLAGAANVLLLAPVWMQLVHLLLSDLVWIGLVLSLVSSEGPVTDAASAIGA